MVKTKTVQAIVFSTVLIIMLILGICYSTGVMGPVLEDKQLTSEGLLGAGLLSLTAVVWLWTLAVLWAPLRKWKNKSIQLTTILFSTFVMPIIAFVYGIVYLAIKKDSEESINIPERKAEE